jgi:hypothetical protein
MRALLELDLHVLRNQLRAIARSPLRLMIWIPYLGLVLGLSIWRLTQGHTAHASDLSGVPLRLATLAGATYLAAFGFAFARHAGGRVQAFRCEAEALLCTNAGVPPLLLTFWLQMRKLCGSALRWLGALILYVAALAPAGAPPETLGRVVLACVLAAVALVTVEIPAYLLGRRRFGSLLIALAWGLTAFGALEAIAAAAELLGDGMYAPSLFTTLGLDPGRAVAALLRGDPATLLFAAALALAPAIALAVLGRDAMPELYEAAIRTRSAGPGLERASGLAQRARHGRNIPGGVLALFWKEWIVLRRRGGARKMLLGACFWAVFGAAIAFALGPADDPALALALLSIATLFIALVPVALSNGLGEDLSKPLWWLATAPLSGRLIAWTFSRSWPGGTALAAMPLVIGLALHHPNVALAAWPVAVLVWWSLQALGLALVALFPSRLDMRGPVGVLRIAAAGVYLLVPLGTLTAILQAGGNIATAGLSATALIALQGYGALRIAGYALDRNGALIAAMERAG